MTKKVAGEIETIEFRFFFSSFYLLNVCNLCFWFFFYWNSPQKPNEWRPEERQNLGNVVFLKWIEFGPDATSCRRNEWERKVYSQVYNNETKISNWKYNKKWYKLMSCAEEERSHHVSKKGNEKKTERSRKCVRFSFALDCFLCSSFRTFLLVCLSQLVSLNFSFIFLWFKFFGILFCFGSFVASTENNDFDRKIIPK